jgi:hypothetical protein
VRPGGFDNFSSLDPDPGRCDLYMYRRLCFLLTPSTRVANIQKLFRNFLMNASECRNEFRTFRILGTSRQCRSWSWSSSSQPRCRGRRYSPRRSRCPRQPRPPRRRSQRHHPSRIFAAPLQPAGDGAVKEGAAVESRPSRSRGSRLAAF